MHHFFGDGQPRHQIRLSFSYLTPDEITAGLDRLAAFVFDTCASPPLTAVRRARPGYRSARPSRFPRPSALY
ncbi:hypothetical protein NKH77_09170 [Streptomyces sp. M19]